MANLNQINNDVVANVIAQVNGAISMKYEQRNADEDLFLMGVKLGRVLAEQEVGDVCLEFFANQRLTATCLAQACELRKEIDTIAKDIVVEAVKEQVALHGVWSVGPGSYGKDELDLDVAAKYNLQVTWTNQSYADDDIYIEFSLKGRLAKEIKKFGFKPRISGVIECYEGKQVSFYDEKDAELDLHQIRFDLSEEPSIEYVERLRALKDALTKMYVFELAAR